MEPVSTAMTAWTIAKNAGEVSKKLYEFGKTLKDRDLKQQVDEIVDQVRELKHDAAKLEDENRELRERLRSRVMITSSAIRSGMRKHTLTNLYAPYASPKT